MARTPDRRPGETDEEGIVLENRPSGEDPTSVGGIRYVDGAFKFKDAIGLFNPRTSTPGGANTEVQFNNNGTLSGSSLFTFNSSTGAVTASYFTGSFGKFSFLTANSLSGSLTRLADGTSYLIAGNNIGITSGSNGSIIISATSTATQSEYFFSTTAGSIYTTGSVAFIGNQSGVDSPYDFGPDVNFYVSGSLTENGADDPSIVFGGDTFISGAFGVSDYIQLKPVGSVRIPTNTSASYLYTSGTTNDLYYTQYQPGTGYTNTVRMRWFEGGLSTGLLHGGVLSTQNGTTTFSLTSGSALFVDYNASTTTDPYPTPVLVKWPTFISQSLTYSGSAQITYIGINSSGGIIQQTTPFAANDFADKVVIGRVLHQTGSITNGVITSPVVAYAQNLSSDQFARAFGPLKVSGHVLSNSGSNLSLAKTAGVSYVAGRNYTSNPNSPNLVLPATDLAPTTCKIFREYVSGSSPVIDSGIANAGYPTIDPTKYNNNGTLTTVSAGQYSIQRVYWFPNSVNKAFFVYYGNSTYATLDLAEAGLVTELFTEGANTQEAAVYLGAVLVKGNASDLSDSSQARIIQGGLFRNVGQSGGGGGGAIATVPGGLDTYVQFNDGGSTFGGDSGFTYNKTTDTLTIGNISIGDTGLLSTTGTSVSVFDSNATTVSFAGAATSINMGTAAGTNVISGTIKAPQGLSGSLTKLTDGTSFIVSGGNMSVITGSNGAIILATINSGTVQGTGTTNFISKFTNQDTLGNSSIYDNGSGIVSVTGSFLPGDDNVYSLGSTTKRWANVYATSVSGSLTGSNLAVGQVVVAGAGGVLSGSNNFWWDNSNRAVGIGTSSPQGLLTVSGSAYINDLYVNSNGQARLFSTKSPAGGTGDNIFIGGGGQSVGIGTTNYQGSRNTSLGVGALNANTIGSSNVAIGSGSLANNTTGATNVAVGNSSLFNSTTGTDNTALGYVSLYSNTTGIYNTAIGSNSLYSHTTGDRNTAAGFASALNLTTGFRNTALGAFSLYSTTTGIQNTAIGRTALYSNISGSYNVAIGHEAGRYIATGAALTTATGSIYIGHAPRGADVNQENQIVIAGTNAAASIYGVGLGSNTTVIGNSATVKTYIAGNVGVGGTNPIARLEVTGSTNDNTSATFHALNSANNSLLFVRNDGNVGVGNSSPTATLHVGNSDSATFLINGGSKILIRDASTYIQEIGGLQIESGTGRSLHLRTAGTQRLSIDTSGNVGIGTSVMTDKLAVDGSVSVTGSILPGVDNTYNLGSSIKRWANVYATSISGSLTGSNVSAGQVLLGGTGGVISGSNDFIWDNSNRRVGIGTGSPIGKFSVGSGTQSVVIDSTGTGGVATIQSYNGALKINDLGNNTIFNTGGGTVGIGTTNPSASKLFVSGSATLADSVTIIKAGVVSPTGGAAVLDVQNSAGTSLLFVSGSGFVGVGTTSNANSSYTFGVRSAANSNIGVRTISSIGGSGTGAGFDSLTDAGGVQSFGMRAATYQFLVAPTQISLYIAAGGNVGIGSTTTVSARLQVSGSSTSTTPTATFKAGIINQIGAVFDAQDVNGTSIMFVSGSGEVGLSNNSVVLTANLTTATLSATTLMSLSSTVYRSVEFVIHGVDASGGKYMTAKVLAIHDGSTTNYVEYGQVNVGGTTGTINVTDPSAGTFLLQVTPASTNSTVWRVTAILTRA